MTILNEEFYDEVKYQVGQKVRVHIDNVPAYSLNGYVGVITAIKTKHVHTKKYRSVMYILHINPGESLMGDHYMYCSEDEINALDNRE